MFQTFSVDTSYILCRRLGEEELGDEDRVEGAIRIAPREVVQVPFCPLQQCRPKLILLNDPSLRRTPVLNLQTALPLLFVLKPIPLPSASVVGQPSACCGYFGTDVGEYSSADVLAK